MSKKVFRESSWSLMVGAALLACAPSGGEGGLGDERGARDSGPSFGNEPSLDGGEDSPYLGDAACAAVAEEANETPLSLYVMFDKSKSMEQNKWPAAKAGLRAFVEDPDSAGINIGLKFFPERPGPGKAACRSEPYMVPDVDFGLLPAHAGAIMAHVESEYPDGSGTPVYPALGGAVRKSMDLAKNAKDENRAASFAILLITDGAPEAEPRECPGVDPLSFEASAQQARLGLDHGIRTFVVGLPGVDLDFANLVAEAGGTEQAIFVKSNDASQFHKALAEVRGQALPCEYDIPQQVRSGNIGITQVNIVWTPSDGRAPEIIPQTQDCAQGGWHYDNAQKPEKILLCPSTCQIIKDDLSAKIDIELGCATIAR